MFYGTLKWIARRIGPLRRQRNAIIAAVVGLLAGGLGLGLYLRSFRDFLIASVLTGVAMAGVALTGQPAMLLFSCIAASLYGFHRVRASNAQLEASPA